MPQASGSPHKPPIVPGAHGASPNPSPVATQTAGPNRIPARIERFVYLGSTTQVYVTLPGGDRLQALVANAEAVEEYDVGAAVTAHLPPDALRILAEDEVTAS